MDNKETQSPELENNGGVAGNEAVASSQATASHSGFAATPAKKGNNPFWMVAAIVLAIALVLVIIFPVGGKSETLAEVNGTKITEADLFNTLQTYYGDSIVSVLDRMVTEELVNQEAKAKNITLTDKDITDEIAAMKLDYGTEEGFQSFLSYYGMTEDDLKNELKLSATVRLLLQSQIEVTDEQVQTYFDENKANLGGSAEQVRASHILVADKELAEDLLAQLKNGADFAELAAEYGTDATNTRGGDLDFFTRDAMVAEFSDAAFALEVNELSDVVQTEFGYHIILKTDYKEATEVNFDSVKDAIRIKLINDDIYANHSTYVEDLRAAAKITNTLNETNATDSTGTDLGTAEEELPTDGATEGETPAAE